MLLSIEYLKVLRFEIHFDEFGKIEAKKDVFMLSDKTKRHYEFMCANERGNYLYTGTSIGEIHIFDIARGRIVNSFTVSNTPIIRIEDYGDYFVISNKEKQLKKVFLLGETYDVQNKDLTERIVYIANNKPEKLDNFLISDEGSILRFKPETHTYTFWRKLPTNQVAQVSISENKGIIAVACTNGDCEFWNLKYKTFINRYTTDKEISCSQVHISDRHDLCVLGYTDGSIRAFGIKDLDLSTEIKCNYVIHKAHKTAIKSIELKENTLITGAADSMIRVWDFRMKNIINEVQYHCKEISLLKLSNLKTDTLFTASKDRQISTFSLRNQRKMSCSILPNGYVTALYQINDNYIITAGYNCDITLWNLHQMVAEKRITVLKPVVNMTMLNEDLIAWTDAEGFLTIHSLSKNKTVYELRVTYMKIIDFFTIANRDVLIICETGEFIEIELPF